MSALRRGTIVGAAYGVAVTAVETWLGTLRFMSQRIPAMTENQVKAVLLEVGLGVVLGIAATPLARLRGGGAWVLVVIATIWTVLARVVAPDPSVIPMWATAPIAGFALVAVGTLIGRRWPRVPWLVGTTAIAAAVVTPAVAQYIRTRDDAPPPATTAARPGAPDVVLVVLDTVRAQNTSAYGYPRPTTPTLEHLATEGTLFLDATSPSTWSLPSHGSLFTGWFPSAHGADGDHRHLGPTPPTLAEVLAGAGYDTRCFTANPHISDSFGLTRGFRWSDRAFLTGGGGRSFLFIYRLLDLIGISAEDKGGGDVAGHFEGWMASRPAQGPPQFVFLNFLEAHFPYHQVPDAFLAPFTNRSRRDLRAVSLEVFGAQFGRPLTPTEIAEAVPPSIDMYDAGILYSDHLLSRVVEALRKSGRLGHTILVVLADHGEMIGEHGSFGHGAALYEPAVRVPLLVRYPPMVPAGRRVTAPVSTVGVFATVLELAAVAPPGPVHVGSLLPAIEGRAAGAPIIVERSAVESVTGQGGPMSTPDRRYRTYRSGSLKLVETSRGDTFLFDLAGDPGEEHDVAAGRANDVAHLREELGAWTKSLGLPAIDAPTGTAPPAPEVDPATLERLKALGYAQ